MRLSWRPQAIIWELWDLFLLRIVAFRALCSGQESFLLAVQALLGWRHSAEET